MEVNEKDMKKTESEHYEFLVSKLGVRIIEKGVWHSFFLSDKISKDIQKLKEAIKLYEEQNKSQGDENDK